MSNKSSLAPSSLLDRREQMFPQLNPTQISTARRFGGETRRFNPGEEVFRIGQIGAPAYLVLSGSIEVSRRDAFGNMTSIVTQGPGEITGEVSQLAGGSALAEGRAGHDGAEVVPYEPAQLRALVVGTAEIGEMIMRAFILRRVFLIETGAGMVLLGAGDTPDALRLQNFLRRNAVPYTLLDPHTDEQARQLIERLGVSDPELPLAICPEGSILRKPDEKALAQCLGLLPTHLADRAYDVAIVGAGPAGLATAVYAASEGLSVLVLDARAFGGQAGASARIENYLGFPTGISGEALAGRAYTQAQKFGAVMGIPIRVKMLTPAQEGRDGHNFELQLDDAQPVRASTVVIASGARYRKLDLPNFSDFENRGIYYWASPIETKLCARREVVVVGGGNSAGQGTVFLSDHVARIYLLVRSARLEDGMSQYLCDRIRALANVDVRTETEVTQLCGDPHEGLQAVSWRHRPSGKEETHGTRHMFLFIGAEPNTEWLRACEVSTDAKGFVQTGAVTSNDDKAARLPLETSRRGVFAVGDVRAGSVKRVSAAVGEGASAVAQLHDYLRSHPAN